MDTPFSLRDAQLRRLAGLVSHEYLELILMPTEACNFRCVYCYEDFAIGRMRADVAAGLRRLVEQRAPELRVLHYSWFGGEPLLARDLITDLGAHAQQLADSHSNLAFSASMTTNAFLLNKDVLRQMTTAGVRRYQISLDGWQEGHDRTRRRADGTGTFSRIWANLLGIRDSDYPGTVLIRIHLTADNIASVEKLTDHVREEFIHDRRFEAFFKPVGRWGGPSDSELHVLSGTRRKGVLTALSERLWGPRSGDVAAQDQVEESAYVCYASRANSLVVRADGRIGKCTVALQDPRNTIGRIQPDGTLSVRQEHLSLWLRGLKTMDAAILACPNASLPDISVESGAA